MTADVGLGTTFERWALNRLLEELRRETGACTVLEGPGDGMSGIAGLNSLALARSGAQVAMLLPDPGKASFARQVWSRYTPRGDYTILDAWDGEHLPFEEGVFDLVWNFNVMNRVPASQGLLLEMVRVSRRWVLVFVPNSQNYAFGLHRLHHRVSGEPWDHGKPELLRTGAWSHMFQQAGLKVRRVMWVDCPWWPDIVDLRQMLLDFFPFLKSRLLRRWVTSASPERRYRWEAADLPYYQWDRHAGVQERMQKLAFIENRRWPWLKARFAHHFGVLGEKEI